MYKYYFYIYLCFVRRCFSLEGWDYISLHCRDNYNKPVDWWYIYKPPGDPIPYLDWSPNFSYITPQNSGRWQLSEMHITTNSMLQHTLMPMFKPTYMDHLAVAVYEKREASKDENGSIAYGVLMADELGGLWITHSVPGLPDLTKDRPLFPTEEIANGHLLLCLSVNLSTLNEIAFLLQQVSPKFTHVQIPKILQSTLSNWNFSNIPAVLNSDVPAELTFLSNANLRTIVMARRPGNNQCLYRQFAEHTQIVLDVYSQTDSEVLTSVCGNSYSVRNIENISLKYPEQVYYIGNMTDKSRFGVSTAAHWQKRGSGPIQYWTCISNLDKEDVTAKGGLILCVEDYYIWLTFDNLKIKEPEC